MEKTAQAILNALDSPDGELSILIIDDPQIEKLNEAYLNRKGPTNVIAFPMREGDFSELNPQILGDVVISTDTAKIEADRLGISTESRIIQLLVHGILHLFGYDHEKTTSEARKMAQKENEILDMLKDLNI